MAGTSLLTLIDDIAAVLDDVAILSKVAAKKTAGVLGDDLALNAEQVSGVKANRELPVVWAVAKGSFLNKIILVPSALLISAFAPSLIMWLLMLGGLFLCFEGAEKILDKFFHQQHSQSEHQQHIQALADENVDLVALEKDKIRGAIRTDFILSAEIIVIILGTVQQSPFATQVMVLSSLAILFTIGVYGLVAGIVKLDDLGLYLLRKSVSGSFNAIQRFLGRALLIIAPNMMKLLTIVGTIAMFLVGGGILVHNLHWLHEIVLTLQNALETLMASYAHSIGAIIIEGLVGLIAGLIVVGIISIFSRFKSAH
ncbi:DUF808 domain-containing protein [Thalassotalea sp. PLHSN55]|uniref:DUF808 domain-containing protein n=1 Tax=Thalassotalea sp. PLHSN55 TaxID=3435888 RepID=UPI003F8501C5